jgi:hypothetical protein
LQAGDNSIEMSHKAAFAVRINWRIRVWPSHTLAKYCILSASLIGQVGLISINEKLRSYTILACSN